MNSTSPSSRPLTIAARSPARSTAGPEVERMLTPRSRAMIWASEVLPSPGGPEKSTWSRTSPRWRAASIDMPRIFRVRSCPTNSPSMRGRNERSSARSSSLWPAAASRAASATASASSICGLSFTRQHCERLADNHFELALRAATARGGSVYGPARVDRFVAEVDERGNGVIEVRGAALSAVRRAVEFLDALGDDQFQLGGLVAQLAHHALGHFGAYARDGVEPFDILARDRAHQLIGRQHGEYRQRELGADVLHQHQEVEGLLLGAREKAVQRERVLAHDLANL